MKNIKQKARRDATTRTRVFLKHVGVCDACLSVPVYRAEPHFAVGALRYSTYLRTGELFSILTMSQSSDLNFDKSLCIICQSKDYNLTSTINGCEKIRKAANQRQDTVSLRLNQLTHDELFQYHVSNTCYKTYVNNIKLQEL